MILALPESLEARLSPQSAAEPLDIGLFVTEKATLGQAAEEAGLTQADFLRELCPCRIPIHCGAAERKQDLRTVAALAPRSGQSLNRNHSIKVKARPHLGHSPPESGRISLDAPDDH